MAGDVSNIRSMRLWLNRRPIIYVWFNISQICILVAMCYEYCKFFPYIAFNYRPRAPCLAWHVLGTQVHMDWWRTRPAGSPAARRSPPLVPFLLLPMTPLLAYFLKCSPYWPHRPFLWKCTYVPTPSSSLPCTGGKSTSTVWCQVLEKERRQTVLSAQREKWAGSASGNCNWWGSFTPMRISRPCVYLVGF